MTDITIGIDISKDTLDVHRLPSGEKGRFTNDRDGHRAVLDWIGDDIARVVFEPTARYHRTLERYLADAGLPLVKVNPLRARRFAESYGHLAKTDACDATMLARMGAAFDLSPHPVADKELNALRELHVARTALVKDRTAAKNREKTLTIALLKRQATQRLAHIERFQG
jgi:transposase